MRNRPILRLSARLRTGLRTLLPALLLGLPACDISNAMGEANSLIVLAPADFWQQVEEPTYAVLEPEIFTSRPEKQYVVTGISPDDPAYGELRVFRNVIVPGTADDPTLQEVAEAGGVDLRSLQPGRVFQVQDIWARGQTVTGVLLRPRNEVDSWIQALPSVLRAVDGSYRAWVHRRMFATPPDSALADDLAARFGFRIYVPGVYDRVARGTEAGDSLVILRNDNPDPAELIRSVLVMWRPRVDSLTSELVLDWRASIDDVQYNVAQGIDTTSSTVTEFQLEGRPALEVTGVWRDEVGNLPAAGPFIDWAVDCGDRTYLIDAWLYAPNEPKYEYMLQLQEILGSFRCAGASSG